MRLATITNWAYGITVVLTLASGTTMLLASSAQEEERVAVSLRYTLDRATATIDEDVFLLSDLSRKFVVGGNPADLVAYQQEAKALASVEARTMAIKDVGASADELASLNAAIRWANNLSAEQRAAIAKLEGGDRAGAISILFSAEYERELDRIRTAVERFQYRLDQRTETTLQKASHSARLWRSVSETMLGITALLFLCVLYFVFRRRVLHPVVKLSDVVGRLAAQDFAAEPPSFDHVDEIGDMAEALRIFRENGIERQRLEQERDKDRAMRDLLSRMTQRMQSCDSIADLKAVVARFAPEVAPHLAGRLYLLDTSRNAVTELCSWLDPRGSRHEFSPLSCWGLRRGAPHQVTAHCVDVPCDHVRQDDAPVRDTLCLPLAGQNGTLGLLYFERRADAGEVEPANVYVRMLTENVGLALDNLRLRDALRHMAMADPLTTLSNRRQLDQALETQLAEAKALGAPICCAMIDIDHFKHFNDTFGHEAGDAVLKAVAAALKGAIRSDDQVFRYGGEEFLILMPDIDAETAAIRAEEIRARIGHLQIRHEGSDLGAVTVSIGLASAPVHCPWDRVVQTADAALLRAKLDGRNRVVSATAPAGEQAA
jgi:diguanylate cyclase (GGDEF)-like protein